MNKKWRWLFTFLALVLAVVWLAVFSLPDDNFHLIACDVGQGDGLLAVYKNDQILIDGGPDNRILDCLSRYLPFWDRRLELVVLTHPEKDHFGGLTEVFKKYEVENFLVLPLDSGSQEYQVLKNEVGSRGVKVIEPDVGKILSIDLMHLEIVHPSADFLARNLFPEIKAENINPDRVLGTMTSGREPNEFSISFILSFGGFDAFLTGDLAPSVSGEAEDSLAKALTSLKDGQIEYLKVPHHGSKNGLTSSLLSLINPKLAVISVGKNSYGQPDGGILKMLAERSVKVLRTDEVGNIEVISNGRGWWVARDKDKE